MRNLVTAIAICYCVSASADTSLEAALELVYGSERPEEQDVALSRWKAGGAGLWVLAAVYEETLQVAVLREQAGSFTVVARSGDDEPMTIEPLWSYQLKLDLIPYRISDDETAFGVRVSNSYVSTARTSSTEALHLYRLHGDSLKMVFAEFTSRSHFDRSGDTPNESAEHVLIVTKTKHRGFYDLLLRDSRTKRTTTWRWNGERYGQ